ncbi:glycoside hydrolase family 25 protein [Aureimonas sp. Leaf454]|uniref:glycoside hydrolase family 25 protein n=1 Tax=Aureimonas sp. Leaf454 TaxID=1736381 RepID=UPI000A46F651
MQKLRAALSAAMAFACAVIVTPARAEWNEPWKAEDRAIVIDAYEFNPIDWKALTSDKRIAAFINKASDGLPPEWNCRGKSGNDELLCKNRWWKYSVTKELYMTRREIAKTLGLKWGAYHLGRPGNPREQADHFIDFAEPGPDELIALDIEDNTPEWMSLKDAEIFADQIKIRTGRYPVLYTNGSTAKWVADYRDTYKLLSRLPLWYARYRGDITGLFPEDNWPIYALWQFSSMHNCSEKECFYRVKGAKSDIDVNVASLDVAGLRAAWPFAELVRPLDAPPASSTLVASLTTQANRMVASVAGGVDRLLQARSAGSTEMAVAAEPSPPPAAVPAATRTVPAAAVLPASAPLAEAPVEAKVPMVAAYGPSGGHKVIDPLQLLTQAALEERRTSQKVPGTAAAAVAATAPSKTPAGRANGVEVASLGLGDGLDHAMSAVAAVADVPAVPLPKVLFGAAERSKVKRWLELSAARDSGAAALAMPAYVLSQSASAGRGARLVPKNAAAGDRVDGAFRATR